MPLKSQTACCRARAEPMPVCVMLQAADVARYNESSKKQTRMPGHSSSGPSVEHSICSVTQASSLHHSEPRTKLTMNTSTHLNSDLVIIMMYTFEKWVQPWEGEPGKFGNSSRSDLGALGGPTGCLCCSPGNLSMKSLSGFPLDPPGILSTLSCGGGSVGTPSR